MRHLSLVPTTPFHIDARDAAAGEGFRVLVWGGDSFLRTRAARELARHGFSVVAAADDGAARNALARGSFDVIVAADATSATGECVALGEAIDVVDGVLEQLWQRAG